MGSSAYCTKQKCEQKPVSTKNIVKFDISECVYVILTTCLFITSIHSTVVLCIADFLQWNTQAITTSKLCFRITRSSRITYIEENNILLYPNAKNSMKMLSFIESHILSPISHTVLYKIFDIFEKIGM